MRATCWTEGGFAPLVEATRLLWGAVDGPLWKTPTAPHRAMISGMAARCSWAATRRLSSPRARPQGHGRVGSSRPGHRCSGQRLHKRIRNDARRFFHTERQLCRACRITEFRWNPGHRLMGTRSCTYIKAKNGVTGSHSIVSGLPRDV
jgi:hypothetical protein